METIRKPFKALANTFLPGFISEHKKVYQSHIQKSIKHLR